jgi:hypothetical protein
LQDSGFQTILQEITRISAQYQERILANETAKSKERKPPEIFCLSDDQGLIEMLSKNIDYFKSKPMELPKTTILLDNGYHPDKLTQALEQIYPEIMTKIQFVACFPKGAFNQTIKSRERDERTIWICACCC